MGHGFSQTHTKKDENRKILVAAQLLGDSLKTHLVGFWPAMQCRSLGWQLSAPKKSIYNKMFF